jgi:hypothetical protein
MPWSPIRPVLVHIGFDGAVAIARERTRPRTRDRIESDVRGDFDRLSTRRFGTARDGGHRAFVTAALASCLALLAAVLTLNTIVDPFAIAGTGVVPAAVQTDRAVKLTLLERYPGGPNLLVLGNSRARQAEPAFLRRLIALRGFNAGVSSGRASDAYVFTRYAADVHPRQRRRYIWFVDVWSMMNGVNPQLADDPRAKRYLDGSGRFGLRDAGTYISTRATAASLRAIRECVVGSCVAQSHRYRADGSLRDRAPRVSGAQARKVRAAAAGAVRRIRRNPPGAGGIAPRPYVYFERALAFMNARGERPVIVLNPRYPTVLAEQRRHGHPERRVVLAYLRRLRARFDFVFVDAENIRRWGGTARDFSDSAHIHWLNMRRLLRYVVAHSDGALR